MTEQPEQQTISTETSTPFAKRSSSLMDDSKPLSHRWSDKVNNDLTWKNIHVTLNNGSNNKDGHKAILQNVWGTAKAGETTAIMGASGAGKTTLFSVLAGRLQSKNNAKLSVQHDIRLGGAPIAPDTDARVRHALAFVAQGDEALHATSTPRESLAFSARLRLPKTTTKQAIDQLVQEYLQDLGLQACADTVMGAGLKKGISGGEKRRVSIGIELISEPKIVFLDEPTSGLDSHAAKQVMALLRRIAHSNTAVIFTIHQPSSDVFNSFDNLILLNQGRVMYQGATKNVDADFEQCQFPMPAHYNPADWILDVAQENSIETLEKAGFFPLPPAAPEEKETCTETQTASKTATPTASEHSGDTASPIAIARHQHVSMWTEFVMLVAREKISLIRNPTAMIISIVMTAFLSVISGVIFFEIGKQDRTDVLVLQAQLGALVNLLISNMMGQSQTTLMVFSSERPLFLREYATNHYSIIPYVGAHLLTEMVLNFVGTFVQAMVIFFMVGLQQEFWQYLSVCFALSMTCSAVCAWLGAIFADPKVASGMFVPLFVPQFYFSGVFIPVNLIPSWVRWGQWLCSLTYASRLAILYEFQDCDTAACDDFLATNNADEDAIWWYWLALIALFLGFRFLAAITLRHKGLHFG